MGIDIHMYAEKRKGHDWKMCMPEKYFETHTDFQYCNSFDVGGRVPTLFQILSGLYNDGRFGADFKIISKAKGLPENISGEVSWYMEDLSGCSWLCLKEILEFDWDSESEEYGIYREIVPEQFFDIISFLQSNINDSITEKDLRIVFGYSA